MFNVLGVFYKTLYLNHITFKTQKSSEVSNTVFSKVVEITLQTFEFYSYHPHEKWSTL